MYVTKLGNNGRQHSTDKRGDIRIIPTDRHSGDRRNAYTFDNLESLLCVCRRLLGLGFDGDSWAYRDRAGQCYLLLHPCFHRDYATLDELSFINEYGSVENADRLMLYISEHANCLCEKNAVATLGVL